MSDSTSIESLSSNNISLTTTEKQQPVQNNNKGNIDKQEPSKMINGITELSSKNNKRNSFRYPKCFSERTN